MDGVDGEVGADAVTVVVGTTEELDNNVADHGLAWIGSYGMYGWVHANDGSGIGIWFADASAWPDVVVPRRGCDSRGNHRRGRALGSCVFDVSCAPQSPHECRSRRRGRFVGVPKRRGEPRSIGELPPTKPAGSASGRR